MELISSKGAKVAYSEPHVPVFPKMRDHALELTSEHLSSERIRKYDAVILTTGHEQFNYEIIERHATLRVDTRGKFPPMHKNVVRA